MASREELEKQRDDRNYDTKIMRGIAKDVYGDRMERIIAERRREKSDAAYPELRAAREAEPTPREAQYRKGLAGIKYTEKGTPLSNNFRSHDEDKD